MIDVPVVLFPTRKVSTVRERGDVFSIETPNALKLVDDQLFNGLLYPEFILMGGRIPRRQWFKDITLKDKSISVGVLHFLRDSFGDLVIAHEPRDILIEKLIGANDLSKNIEKARRDSPLLDKVRSIGRGSIELHNVMIRFNDNNGSNSKEADWSLYFEFDNEYWLYRTNLNNINVVAWDFKKLEGQQLTDFQKVIREFKASFKSQQIPEQKKIPEVLRKKMLEGRPSVNSK
jgi:hypothetical protein